MSSSSSSSYVDATATAVDHCELMAKEYPDLAETYINIANYSKLKLWHQLTVTILQFVTVDFPGTARTVPVTGQHSYLALYDAVVLPAADRNKLNALATARIAAATAAALAPTDVHAAKAVLENLLQKTEFLGSAGVIYTQSKLNLLQLLTLQPTASGDAGAAGKGTETEDIKESLASIYKTIQQQEEQLAALPSVTASHHVAAASQNRSYRASHNIASNELADLAGPDQAVVYAAHYEQAMTYYKVTGPPEAFYEQAMQFLNYAPPPPTVAEGSSKTEVLFGTVNYRDLAVDLVLAALTGEGVYNLAQVEQNPVLQLLQNTPEQWLVELLVACSAGNVLHFQKLVQETYAAQVAAQPTLQHRATAVQEKLTLLALVQYIFEKPAADRTVTFEEIAAHIFQPVEQVEWVLMRALSVHLLEGTLDQVDGTVTITWVMPRVLTASQMQKLASRFGTWAATVSKCREAMQEQTPTFA